MLENEIAARIVQYIVDKQLPPGAKLPSIRELSAAWRCNPSQVRTGLITLATMGVIEMHPRAGSFVRQLSSSDMDGLLVLFFRLGMLGSKADTINFYEVKRLLDKEIFPSAVKYRTDRDLYDLDLIIGRQQLVLDKPHLFIEEDELFHVRLAQILRNPLIEFLMAAVQGMIRPYRKEYMNEEICRAAYQDHVDLLAAMRAERPEDADRIAHVHSLRRLQQLERALAGA